MKRGFYTIMTAQFFSVRWPTTRCSLRRSNCMRTRRRARVAARRAGADLSPSSMSRSRRLVGAFADARPKGRVMFISNAIKVVGCLLMLFGTHPLLAYALVGLGAAAYSPAKYGILTELLPAVAAGQGQRLDRRPHHRLHHPGRRCSAASW
jgi:LPLT family lysophospholipid transporter-like MFS transporter